MDRRAIEPAAWTLLAAAAFLVMGSARASTSTLYERMGGEPVVSAVVGDLIDQAASEPRLKRSFAKVGLKRLKQSLARQICEISGGGCAYEGDSMHDVHAGLGITQAEFYGLVELLRRDLRAHGVALRERNELLALLAPMKRDIVER